MTASCSSSPGTAPATATSQAAAIASRCTALAARILVSARPSSLWKTARSLTVGPPGKRAVCVARSVMSSSARRARPIASGGTSLETKAGMPSRNRSPPRTAGMPRS